MQTFKQYHEARSLAIRAKKAGVDLTGIDQDELLKGIEIEREHDGERGKDVDVVGPKIDLVKIAVAHLREKPDYYTRLQGIENS